MRNACSFTNKPACVTVSPFLFEIQSRQHRRAFFLDRIQAPGIEPQGLKNGRGYLDGFDKAGHGAGLEIRIRNQQHHVGIIVSEASVLGLLLRASGIDHAHVRLNDDIGSAGIALGGSPGALNIVSSEGP